MEFFPYVSGDPIPLSLKEEIKVENGLFTCLNRLFDTNAFVENKPKELSSPFW